MENRVVVTGLGAITPIGNTVEEFWNNAKEGVCGIDYIKGVNVDDIPAKVAGEVKNFNPEKYIPKKEARRIDKFCQYAIAASDDAIKDSKLNLDEINKDRFGVIVSSGIGGLNTMEEEITKLAEKGARRVSPFFIPMSIVNIAPGNIAIRYGAKGPAISMVTACASGTNAIGEAYRMIKHGYSDVMIAGGTEASITRAGLAGFANMKALSTSNDPKRASIPFDKERDGFVMGEGSGVIILENLEHALKRGAKIYAEIVGYGATCDAYHMTSPDPEGEGARKAMKLAIEEANIEAKEVGYINAHGTSTPYNDKFETLAIKKLFKEEAKNISISSSKSMTGHLLGAAGGIEAIICIKALEDSFIPPTINYEVPDEECDLDYVPNVGRNKDIKYALSNSLGFGGQNASILLKKWDKE